MQRQRYMDTLRCKPTDRIPFIEWGIRKATMEAWIKQGYPEGMSSQAFFGLDNGLITIPIKMNLYPEFEQEIIEESGEHKIWIDNLGATRKDFVRDDTPGFVTRSWLRFPVENRDDFLKMKKRYDPSSPERYPSNWKARAEILNLGDMATHLSIPYLFWVARDWMGFENLCMAFYDMPELIDEMFEFLTDFCIETLKRGIKDIKIDVVELKEDMAYKHAPMISPEMFKRFMAPHYRRIIDYLKSNGAEIVFVDCDGYPGGLIPEWIELGVDGMSPVEIAAGNDMLELRKQYPSFIMWGGIDKRELAKDEKAVYNEVMGKVPELISKGRYIPHVDHAIPPDVSLKNYIYYRKLIDRIVFGKEQ